LVVHGGLERSEEQFVELLAAHAFRLRLRNPPWQKISHP